MYQRSWYSTCLASWSFVPACICIFRYRLCSTELLTFEQFRIPRCAFEGEGGKVVLPRFDQVNRTISSPDTWKLVSDTCPHLRRHLLYNTRPVSLGTLAGKVLECILVKQEEQGKRVVFHIMPISRLEQITLNYELKR